jgi:hypothetical protein
MASKAHLADFGGDGEAGGHVEAQVGHFAEVGALAAKLQAVSRVGGDQAVSRRTGGQGR